MTEQTTPTQEVEKKRDQPYEAGFSTNFFLNHPKMGRLQFTFRGATSGHWGEVLRDLRGFLEHMRGDGWIFDGEMQSSIPTKEVTRQPIDDSGNALPPIFKGRAGRLSVEMKDNKYSFKIEDAQFQQGRKGSKFGIRVWDEVLTGAGLNIEPGQPMPEINGWEFEYVENEKGYPYKVTRLLPKK